MFTFPLPISMLAVPTQWDGLCWSLSAMANDGSYSYPESSLDFPWICIWWGRWSLKILIIWKRRNVLKCNLPTQLISSCLCTSHARVKSTRGGVVILCLCMMWPWWRSYITCEPPGLFEIFHRNHYGWDSSKKCKFLWNIYSSWEQTATIWGYLVHTLSEKIYKIRNCYSF